MGLNGVSNNGQHPDRPAAWNLDVILPAIKAAIPETSPQAIAGALDTSGFFIPNAKAFVVFMEAWRKFSSEPFPLKVSPCLACHHSSCSIRLHQACRTINDSRQVQIVEWCGSSATVQQTTRWNISDFLGPTYLDVQKHTIPQEGDILLLKVLSKA